MAANTGVSSGSDGSDYERSQSMGSRIYAMRARKRQENIMAMLSLETMTYYSDERENQSYPFLLRGADRCKP